LGVWEVSNPVCQGVAVPCRATNRLYLPGRDLPMTVSALNTVGGDGKWGTQVMGKVRCGSHQWESQWQWPDKGNHHVVQETVNPTAAKEGCILL